MAESDETAGAIVAGQTGSLEVVAQQCLLLLSADQGQAPRNAAKCGGSRGCLTRKIVEEVP